MLTRLAFATTAMALLAQANAAGFLATCKSFKLGMDNLLYLTCDQGEDYMYFLETKDYVADSVLDLGRCYTNKDGKLSTDDGEPYWRSCRGCNLEPRSAWLNCECKHDDKWARTRIDLNQGLSNWKGSICCSMGKCSMGVNNVAVPDMDIKQD